MQTTRVRLGELLVEAQVITRQQLDEVLELQKKDGRRLGTLLVATGLVTETQVTQILSQQLSVPWVSLYHIDFSRQLLNLVPHAFAEKYCLVPIFVRRVRGVGETLYVAMDDPSDETAQREVSQYSGLAVRAMIAPPTDIRSAIRVYYAAGAETASLSEAEAEITARHGALSDQAAAAILAKTSAGASAAARSTAGVPASAARGAATTGETKAAIAPKTEAGASVTSPASAAASSTAVASSTAASSTAAASGAAARSAAVEPQAASSPASTQRSAPGIASNRPPATSASTPPRAEVAGAAVIPASGIIQPNSGGDEEPPPDSSPQIESREVSMPAPKRGRPRKMVTLTLLDGTKINLPPRQKRLPSDPSPKAASELTAGDMVAALRAVAHGADAREILGDNPSWEPLVAAILALLLKKHVIADWEFVDEFRKV